MSKLRAKNGRGSSAVETVPDKAEAVTESTKTKKKLKSKGKLKAKDKKVQPVGEAETVGLEAELITEKPESKRKFKAKGRKSKSSEKTTPLTDSESSSIVHKRRIRLAADEKTATLKEVQEAVKSSIFNEIEVSGTERDYIQQERGDTSGLLTEFSEEDYTDEGGEPLKLSKEIAEAFGIESSIDHTTTEEEQNFFNSEIPLTTEDSDETFVEAVEDIGAAEEIPKSAAPPIYNSDVFFKITNVVDRLGKVADEYFSKCEENSDEVCLFDYVDENVDTIVISDESNIQLANYRVYVNGEFKDWDNLFEVKVPAGSLIEIETGVRLRVPNWVKVKLSAVTDLKSKYSLESLSEDRFLSLTELKEPIVMAFRACEGAYLSKVGRVIECQLIE